QFGALYASPPISLRRTPTFPHSLPSSGNLRFYSGAPPLEIRFYVFTRYFMPEMGAILLVNEALREPVTLCGFSLIHCPMQFTVYNVLIHCLMYFSEGLIY